MNVATEARIIGSSVVRADTSRSLNPVREFSTAESAVVQGLLAGLSLGGDSLSVRAVPRRTRYHVIRRLHERGILTTRAVPDPAPLGRPLVVFATADAFAEKQEEATALWRNQRELVHLWRAHERLVGVFFARDPAEADSLEQRLSPPGVLRGISTLKCDSRRAGVPVLFDYEGSWAALIGATGMFAYPHPLPSSTLSQKDSSPRLGDRDQDSMRAMLARFSAMGPGPPIPLPPLRLGSRARESRLRKDGLVEVRDLLDPVACALQSPSFFQTLVIARGRLLSETTPERLFHDLIREARLYPFLFATDGDQVFFAFLSEPRQEHKMRDGAPALSTANVVRRHLHEVVVSRDALTSVETPVNHQYGRPFIDGTER